LRDGNTSPVGTNHNPVSPFVVVVAGRVSTSPDDGVGCCAVAGCGVVVGGEVVCAKVDMAVDSTPATTRKRRIHLLGINPSSGNDSAVTY
jgi:hypothetical protein